MLVQKLIKQDRCVIEIQQCVRIIQMYTYGYAFSFQRGPMNEIYFQIILICIFQYLVMVQHAPYQVYAPQ